MTLDLLAEDVSYRIRLPPGSCRRQLTIPTMPQWDLEAVNHTGQSGDAAIFSCSTEPRGYER